MTSKTDKKTNPAQGSRVDEDIVRKIGERLRQTYDETASEAVPDRFTALLEELERSEKAGGSK
ncbi:MAG: NepR family anti-sigma factor [Roseitalea porphyridii]|jgi:hemerythrin-like domain-containing protein|uniref:NepR family anti-sigma factor n=1 Tax=Roseitalea porphyridii TaxID=1852022 RepID=UPI0032EE6654